VSFLTELKRRNVLRVVAAYLVTAWLIVQVVETVFPAFGFGDAAVRLVVTVLGIGLIVVAIAAWALELTPEGLRRDSAAESTQDPAPLPGHQFDRVIIIVLALALGYFAVDKFVLSGDPQPVFSEVGVDQYGIGTASVPSLAVLPFTNMSSDPEQEYLSDGISEELINLLANVPGLRVISRSSSFAFKGSNLKANELADEMNVDYILEGSVRKSGERVRITAQLIEADSDVHLWSETYDRTLDDIFAIQDDIAGSVLPALEVQLLGAAPTVAELDTDAYALYLQALHFYQQRSPEGVERAIDHVLRSIEIEPAHAPSWTLLASAYINQAHARDRPFEEGFELASEAADKALDIDPDFALAHSTRAWIAMSYERDFARSARHFRMARKLAPNSNIVLTNYAILAIRLGRIEEAIRMIGRSIELDPTNSVSHGNLAEALIHQGRFPEAEQAARKAVELRPGNNSARANLALTMILQNRPGDALEVAAPIRDEATGMLVRLMANHDLGNMDASALALESLEESHATDAAYLIAIGYAWRGDLDNSFRWLDLAIDEGQSFFGIKTEIYLDALHDDVRWEDILRKSGLSDEQIADIVI
jgi:adenylate cyclase